ncbi:sodium:proton antiporter [Microbacterium testaceum]|uniref:Sodium:proton antiporter n=1 Tax=Microbacterium testaceum TaxID=2033 RepID=A0A147FCE2_MICTE|nr:sodium:proton antiporter [Microbacterium testaceum]
MSRQNGPVSSIIDDRDDGRPESPAQRADRNWTDVLQELRVLQTGTQILTGFLLALAFQPAFGDLDAGWRAFYLGLVALSALSAVVALAPVALHRAVFRLGIKPSVVRFGHRALRAALVLVSLLLTGVVAFVFGVVVGGGVAVAGAVVLAVTILVLWVVVPAILRHRGRKDDE